MVPPSAVASGPATVPLGLFFESVGSEPRTSAGSSAQALEAHDVFVPNAHEHIVPSPEDRPAVLLLDIGGLKVAFVLELVAANVDAVRVQLEPLLICSGWLVSLADGAGPVREARSFRASLRRAGSGLRSSPLLRSEVLGGGDQRQEHLQSRGQPIPHPNAFDP